MYALLLAVFIVSVGYGVVLPLLPNLIERLLGTGAEISLISRHTGLLTAVYALALFLFAPVWGRLSDRHGRRCILLFGLLGFGVSMLVFSFIESLAAVYAERFLSGMFASAVTPVVAATIGDFTNEEGRGRQLAYASMAGITGFLLGPMLGLFVTRFSTNYLVTAMPVGSVAAPLTATALLAFLVVPVVAYAISGGRSSSPAKNVSIVSDATDTWLVPKLLMLTFIVSTSIGAFEVGLALRGKEDLGLAPYQIAIMFTECSLVMLVMQAIVFSPWVKPDMTRWFISPMLVTLAAGLFLVPWASDFSMMLGAVGAVAASAGVLSPILTYWISAKAGGTQGWELGKQTSAASLGVTTGSAAGGLLHNFAALPGASFLLITVLVLLGFMLSLGLPLVLAPNSLKGKVF